MQSESRRPNDRQNHAAPEGAASDLITVKLTAEDIRSICSRIADELFGDMDSSDLAEGDFAGILQAWREQSPKYVAQAVFGEVMSFAEAEQIREVHDTTADLLERLMKQLPADEVSHG